MMIDKEKLKFVLDALQVVSVFTPTGKKIKWLGIVGEELLSHTTNSFLSEKSTQKWIDYVNSVELPIPAPVVEQPTLEEVVTKYKNKSKGKK
jgi:hypothetical protein